MSDIYDVPWVKWKFGPEPQGIILRDEGGEAVEHSDVTSIPPFSYNDPHPFYGLTIIVVVERDPENELCEITRLEDLANGQVRYFKGVGVFRVPHFPVAEAPTVTLKVRLSHRAPLRERL